MRIVIGSGNNRHTFTVPAAAVRVLGQDGKPRKVKDKANFLEAERAAETLKNYYFRPAML